MIKTIGFDYDVMYFPCGEMHVKIKNFEKNKNAIIEFSLETNCDKTKEECMNHSNILNFGGFLFAVQNWVGRKALLG